MQPGYAVPGVFGTVEVTLPWDPDGPGPLGEHMVVGGTFTLAGSLRANGIAMLDPVSGQWSTLGNLTGQVKALTVMPNGDLVAGGTNLWIGTVDAHCVARWNGTSWSTFGTGISTLPMQAAAVYGFCVRPNGDLVVGGQFFYAGGVQAQCIARWDGAAWQPMGDLWVPILLPSVSSIVALPNGDVIAGGIFRYAGGVPCTHIARWDGATWHAMGSLGPANPGGFDWVRALARLQNGDVIAAGPFGVADGQPANHVAGWNGSSWSPVGSGIGDYTNVLRVLPNGDVLAGGSDLVGTQDVARWDGTSWTGVGNLPPFEVRALASMSNGALFAGGDFRPSGAFLGRGLARWNGTNWQAVATGNDGVVDNVVALGNGRFLVLGDLRSVAGVSVTRAAIFDGQAWSAAGVPADGPVLAATTLPNGDPVIAVRTTLAGYNPVQCAIQLWNGTAWNTIGVAGGYVRAMAVAPSGKLYVGGDFSAFNVSSVSTPGLAVWNGTAWSAAPEATGYAMTALLFRRDGQFVASSSSFPNFVAAWSGTQWVQMGGGLQQPASGFAELSNGDVVATGNWAVVSGAPCVDVARWNGASWQPLGSGVGISPYPSLDRVNRVVALPNGDVLVAGQFQVAGGVLVHNVARWDGTAWHDLGSGADAAVASAVVTPAGEVVLGGSFLTVDGQLSAFVARVEPVCPALAVRYGTSCFGAPESLHIEELAFVGGVLRSRVDGLASGSLVVLTVLGLAPAQVPLQLVLPQGGAGCSLLATPDFLDVTPTTGTVAHTSFAIPRAAALVGAVLYHQVLPVEPAATLGFALKASNGQALVIGGLW